LRAFVERKKAEGWEIATEYVDKASGKSDNRPAFRRMFDAASRKEFDLVLFWSLDRFSREGVCETLNHLQRLTSSGVDWWSYREEYLRSVGVFRDAVLAILAAIAKQERVRISERVTAGLDKARAAGKTLGRPRLIVSRAKVWALHDAGKSYREIGQLVGISHGTVQNIIAARA